MRFLKLSILRLWLGNLLKLICLKKKLVIELDGGRHTNHQAYDKERTAFLISKGHKVLRFWNHEVLTQTERVVSSILLALENENIS